MADAVLDAAFVIRRRTDPRRHHPGQPFRIGVAVTLAIRRGPLNPSGSTPRLRGRPPVAGGVGRAQAPTRSTGLLRPPRAMPPSNPPDPRRIAYAFDALEQVCLGDSTVWRMAYEVSAHRIHYRTRTNPKERLWHSPHGADYLVEAFGSVLSEPRTSGGSSHSRCGVWSMPEWDSEFRSGNRLSREVNGTRFRWAPHRLPHVHSWPSLVNKRVVPSPGAKAQGSKSKRSGFGDGTQSSIPRTPSCPSVFSPQTHQLPFLFRAKNESRPA